MPLYPAPFFFWKTTSIHIGVSSLRFSLLHLIRAEIAKNERNHKNGSRIHSHYFKKIWEKNRVLSAPHFFWGHFGAQVQGKRWHRLGIEILASCRPEDVVMARFGTKWVQSHQ